MNDKLNSVDEADVPGDFSPAISPASLDLMNSGGSDNLMGVDEAMSPGSPSFADLGVPFANTGVEISYDGGNAALDSADEWNG